MSDEPQVQERIDGVAPADPTESLPEDPTASVQRIDPSELAYFRKVSGGLDRAAQLEVEANRLLTQATALRGAYESWVEHLAERYGLNLNHDQIDSNSGAICRDGQG